MARSWHMLNTTAVSPIDMAFASPGGGKCCPRPTVIIELPDGQLPDPNQAAPCKACSTMLVAVDNNMLLLERTRALCLDLAVLLNSNPALTGLMPPGNLSFACNTDMPVSASGTQMQFQVTLWVVQPSAASAACAHRRITCAASGSRICLQPGPNTLAPCPAALRPALVARKQRSTPTLTTPLPSWTSSQPWLARSWDLG